MRIGMAELRVPPLPSWPCVPFPHVHSEPSARTAIVWPFVGLVDPTLTAIAIGGVGMQVGHWFAPGTGYTREQVADAYVHLALRMAGYTTPSTEA
jgi:Tetracyclin repressor-like, C-terminal domain